MLNFLLDPSQLPLWIIIGMAITLALIFPARRLSLVTKFVYPNAKFGAIGNSFLKEDELNRLLAEDLDDFKNILNGMRDYDLRGESVKEIQNELDESLIEMILMLKEDSPTIVGDFYDAYLNKLDTHLIKKGLRMVLKEEREKKEEREEKKERELDASKAILKENRELLEKMEREDLPLLFMEYNFPDELVELLKREEVDFLKIESLLDRAMLNRFDLLTLPKKCKDASNEFIKIYKDILNIKAILRAREREMDIEMAMLVGTGREIAEWKIEELLEMEDVSEVISHLEGTSYISSLRGAIVEYEEEKSVYPLEKALDECFIHLLANLSIEHSMDLGPGIRFVVSKEYEIQNLKAIAEGIGEGLPPEKIRPMWVIE